MADTSGGGGHSQGSFCHSEFLRMPFGMNSGATLVRGMMRFLQDLDHLENYIDDLIVYTKDWDTHCKYELLRRLQQTQLAVQPTNCLFGLKSVEFLGHLVDGDWWR